MYVIKCHSYREIRITHNDNKNLPVVATVRMVNTAPSDIHRVHMV